MPVDTSTPTAITRFGELRLFPGYLASKDSLVPLAPVQSVSFRGVRWTARDFYIRMKRGGRDISIQWLEPIPGEGRKVVDTVYGPISWRNGKLVSDLSLRAPAHSPLLVQLDTAAALDSSCGWLEARELSLSRDSTVSVDQDSIWLRLRTGLSLKPERFLLRGPIRWKGSFPRTRIPFPNSTSALKIDTLWLVGNRLEAIGVQHDPARSQPRKFAKAVLSLDRRLLETTLEPDGRWPISPELDLAWKGIARVEGNVPRFSSPVLVAHRPNGALTLGGWCDSTGAAISTESVRLVAVSPSEFLSESMLHRCDDKGMLWKGNVRIRWNERLEDGPLWTSTFEPKGIGIAGLLDERDRPVPVFDSAVRDSFLIGGIEGVLRALPRNRLHRIRVRDLPVVELVAGDSGPAGHIRFPDGTRARILSGVEAIVCSPADTFPVHPIPVLLARSGACLELERPARTISFANTQAWGSLVPDRIWKLENRGYGYRIRGKWMFPKPLRDRMGTDSIPVEAVVNPTQDRFARTLPDTNWSATLYWTIPVDRFDGFGWEDLAGNSVLMASNEQSSLLVSYAAQPQGPRIFKRLESPYPTSWKGRRVGLESARFRLGPDGRIADTSLVWTTVERFDRLEHPWGWVYQFDHPTSARFTQDGTREIFQEPRGHSRMSLPEDGNPNPVAKGLPRPLTPPLSVHSESTLPFSALPAPPLRQGRASLQLDSIGPIAVDRLMATVAQYDSCVAARKCSPVKWERPLDTGAARVWCSRAKWPESVQGGLDFTQAQAYCAYRGGRLPTQQQWRQVLRQSLGQVDSPREVLGIGDREHRCRQWPQVPGQFRPWKSGLFDLVGNGSIWCREGEPCRTPRDSLCTTLVPERWIYGVRCVE